MPDIFLEMAVKYGRELEHPPHVMPSGWAMFLYLSQSEVKKNLLRLAAETKRPAACAPRTYVFATFHRRTPRHSTRLLESRLF